MIFNKMKMAKDGFEMLNNRKWLHNQSGPWKLVGKISGNFQKITPK